MKENQARTLASRVSISQLKRFLLLLQAKSFYPSPSHTLTRRVHAHTHRSTPCLHEDAFSRPCDPGSQHLPPWRRSLSPSERRRKALLQHIEIFPCRRRGRELRPLDQHLWHSTVALLHQASLQNGFREYIRAVKLDQWRQVGEHRSVVRSKCFQLRHMKSRVN